ncbi:MAG: hypothetical protein J2P27_01085 [Actinobacteria bacterium]|nr:hypothetical protein [Actinomycetota bacterium]
MSTPHEPTQLGRADLQRMANDPESIVQAMHDGRLSSLLNGVEPGTCPTCGRPPTDPPPTT